MKKKSSILVLTLSTILFSGCNNMGSEVAEVKKPVVKATKAVVVKKPIVKEVVVEKSVVKKVNPLEGKAKDAIKLAKTANKIVAKAGFDWNVTYTLIKEADKSLKAGDFQVAINKATMAKEYALIGLEQSEIAKTAGPRLKK